MGPIQHVQDMLEESISQTEEKGWIVSTQYYDALIKNQQSQNEQLEKQRQEMLAQLQEGIESGAISKNSEEWYGQIEAIDEITLKLKDGETSIIEWGNAIRDIEWSVFDMIQDKISNITKESDFLIDLMSNKKLYDERGQLTDEGLATMGLHGQNYNVYMQQSDEYAKEIAKLDEEIAKDPYDQELIKRRQELLELQQESILNAEDEKNAIKDMVEEGIEIELDSLQELIDKKNESLEASKEAYEYQKKIAKQTKEISSLEKQIAALQGDDSEEVKSKFQELKVSLEEAQESLEETEFDKYIQDQQAAMDALYTEYETLLNSRLDNIDQLLSDMITEINDNSSVISDAIHNASENVGYTISDELNAIWSNDGPFADVIGEYGNKQTQTNSILSTISENIRNMIEQLNKIAGTDIKGAEDSSAINSDEANSSYKPPEPPPQPPAPNPTPSKPEIHVGGQINAGSATIYATSNGTGGGRQYYRNDPIYTVLSEQNGYILTRHHSLSSGYTGWFRKSDVQALKTGKRRITENDVAWTQDGGAEMIVRPSDGAILTPLAKNDSVLNARASSNIWKMANNPSVFIKDNMKDEVVKDISNMRSSETNITQMFENVNFVMPQVKNYEQMLLAMQSDKNFERLINSMTVDRIAGKSSIGKRKAIR